MPQELENLLNFCQENAEELLGVEEGVVTKAMLVTTISDAGGEWIVAVGADACGNDLSMWDRLGLLRFAEIKAESCMQCDHDPYEDD